MLRRLAVENIQKNIDEIYRRIELAARKAGRKSSEIKLIAVSKKKNSSDIRAAFVAGQKIFAENYAQEFRDKTDELKDLDIEWHFIGHLQKNKVKYIVPKVSCIHSVDSIKIAEEIDKRADRIISCLIEVNLAGEKSKTGTDEENLYDLISHINSMKNLKLIGLMTIPPFSEDPEMSRPYFIRLKNILQKVNNSRVYSSPLKELSMGMTGDLEVAVEEGATIVRIGTGIFGERK